jgi:uncharacterized protein YegL
MTVLAPEPEFVTREEANRLAAQSVAVTPSKAPSGPITTYVALVLDRSSSMGSCVKETISGFNEQLDKLRSELQPGDETLVSLVVFNHEVNILCRNSPVHLIEELDRTNYMPSGTTAMWDAIADAIYLLEPMEATAEGNAAFLVVTLSDGQENSSRRFDDVSLRHLIQCKQESGRWTFTYMGANQDIYQVSRDLSIPLSNTSSYSSTPIGTTKAMSSSVDALEGYMSARRGGALKVSNFFSDAGPGDADKDGKRKKRKG